MLENLSKSMTPDKVLINHLVDVKRYCDNQLDIEGVLPLERCKRLIEMLPKQEAEAAWVLKLHFWRDDKGLYRLSGRASTSVNMICQRCLEPYQQPLESEIALIYFESDEQLSHAMERSHLPEEDHFEPVVLPPKGGAISLDTREGSDEAKQSALNGQENRATPSKELVLLAELLEDDLILALPQVPKHPLDASGEPECPVDAVAVVKEHEPEAKVSALAEGLKAIKAKLSLNND